MPRAGALACAALAAGAAACLAIPSRGGAFAGAAAWRPAGAPQPPAGGARLPAGLGAGPVSPGRAAAPRPGGGAAPALGGAAAGLCVAAALLGAAAGRGRAAQRRAPRTRLWALTEIGSVKLTLPAGKATPAPPVGPALGKFGANIAFFVKEYNALTADKVGETVPCIVRFMSDRSFTIELKTPPTAALLIKAAKAEKGSDQPNNKFVGTISIDQLREIAKTKLPDLQIPDVTRAMKICHGTAKACGVQVEGYEEWKASVFKKPTSILERYGGRVELLPKEGRDIADEDL